MKMPVWQWLLIAFISTIGGLLLGHFATEPIFLWLYGDITKAFSGLAYFFCFFGTWNFIERVFVNDD